MLICPVCRKSLEINEKSASCSEGHSFDRAKEGYINLLTGNKKSGSLIGDNKDMAKSRRKFLEKGYYDFLALFLCEKIKELKGADKETPLNILDISCGEGYYTGFIKEKTRQSVFGFDISKEMIKLGAKKYKDVLFFVGNISKIPVSDCSCDIGIHICAPFCEKEFARILKKDGYLLSAVPGKKHLIGLKEILYENVYENNDDITEYSSLKLVKSETISKTITVRSNEDILNLFKMTPYYYKTSKKDKEKLMTAENLTTQAEFIIRTFKRE